MKLPIKVIIILIFSLCHIHIFAQDKIIEIWNGDVPGAIENNSVEEGKVFTENGARIVNVVTPALSVYFPPEEISNGASVIICPGGGYRRLAIEDEGIGIAEWLNSLGITAFILKYRLPDDRIMEDKSIGPLQDVQESIRIVRRNTEEWRLDPQKIGVLGVSAGGHLAAIASTLYNKNIYDHDSISARPDFSILLYAVISMNDEYTLPNSSSRGNLLGDVPSEEIKNHFSADIQVDENTPPAFLVHSANDGSVSAQNSIQYFLALKKIKIPVELHIYEKGGHGYGINGKGGTESSWDDLCESWLRMHGII